jgi:hypothetical protein
MPFVVKPLGQPPPNLRTGDGDECCTNCVAYDGEMGDCWSYRWPVAADQTCDEWMLDDNTDIGFDEVPTEGGAMRTATSPRMRIVREPKTYEPASPHSWFTDRYTSSRENNTEAQRRLERNVEKTRREPPKVEKRHYLGEMEARYDPGLLEFRAPDLTVAHGAYSVWPAWLTELAAITPHVERVVSALAPSYDMPTNATGYPWSI